MVWQRIESRKRGLIRAKIPSRVFLFETSGNYFDVLRIQPYLGRFFHASDEHGPNSAPYIVLAYAYWHTHFQDDRGVVGRVVQLNKHPFTIVGVAPPGVPRDFAICFSRFLFADGQRRSSYRAESPERARKSVGSIWRWDI